MFEVEFLGIVGIFKRGDGATSSRPRMIGLQISCK